MKTTDSYINTTTEIHQAPTFWTHGHERVKQALLWESYVTIEGYFPLQRMVENPFEFYAVWLVEAFFKQISYALIGGI